MSYKSTSVDYLLESLKDRIVVFEYTKKDGSVRTAKGTLNSEYLPEPIPDIIKFDIPVIDALMSAKNIPSLNEYAKENGLSFVDVDVDNCKYIFSPIKKKVNKENLISYYDIEKDSFRSFIKDNYLGIL